MTKSAIEEEKTLSELINELSREIGDVDEDASSKVGGSSSILDVDTHENENENYTANSAANGTRLAAKYKLSAFPTDMSCTQAFNDLVECYSLGGQLRRVYRYGGVNDCKEQKLKAKFCVFNKLNAKEVQQQKVARFYMEKLARQKLQNGSSEDIWKVRPEPLVEPFKVPEE